MSDIHSTESSGVVVVVLLLHKYGLGYYIAVVVCFVIFDGHVSMIKAMFHVKH